LWFETAQNLERFEQASPQLSVLPRRLFDHHPYKSALLGRDCCRNSSLARLVKPQHIECLRDGQRSGDLNVSDFLQHCLLLKPAGG
jgi:hypothetical protein